MSEGVYMSKNQMEKFFKKMKSGELKDKYYKIYWFEYEIFYDKKNPELFDRGRFVFKCSDRVKKYRISGCILKSGDEYLVEYCEGDVYGDNEWSSGETYYMVKGIFFDIMTNFFPKYKIKYY